MERKRASIIAIVVLICVVSVVKGLDWGYWYVYRLGFVDGVETAFKVNGYEVFSRVQILDIGSGDTPPIELMDDALHLHLLSALVTKNKSSSEKVALFPFITSHDIDDGLYLTQIKKHYESVNRPKSKKILKVTNDVMAK